MRTFNGVNMKLVPPELIPVLKPIVDWIQQSSRALANSVEKVNNPAATPPVPPPPSSPPPASSEFLDNEFRVKDGLISSKVLALECSGIPSSTTVTLTVPAVSGTIALTSTIPQAYPVGALFITTNNYANGAAVAAAIGYGTWAVFGAGRVLIGQDGGTYSGLEGTGGAETKAISAHAGTAVGDHASHTHTYTDVIAHTHTITDPGHEHNVASEFDSSNTTGSGNWYAGAEANAVSSVATTGITIDSTGVATGTTAGPSATLTHSVTQPSNHSDLNVVQPYIVVQMWKRTA